MAGAHREWRNAPVRSTGEAPEDSGNPTDGGCLATAVAGKKKPDRPGGGLDDPA
jgi:hypothetical protein